MTILVFWTPVLTFQILDDAQNKLTVPTEEEQYTFKNNAQGMTLNY